MRDGTSKQRSGSTGNGEGVLPVRYTERTHEVTTEAQLAGRESRHPEAAIAGRGPISKLRNELSLQPTVFYRWQKEVFENGASALEQKRPSNHAAELEPIAYLEKKIHTKDEFPAELRAEHVPSMRDMG